MIIAVDGTAASGKGTLASLLASALNLAHLDTGTLYRRVALGVIDSGINSQDITPQLIENIDFSTDEDTRIRSPEVGEMAAIVAAIPEVRTALLNFQRSFARNPPNPFQKTIRGAILDGRDIATVVLPDADVKLFVDADAAIRAERRYKELINAGHKVMLPDILAALVARDERDQNREHAPLKQADDAILVDTSHLGVDAMVEFALSHIKRKGDPC